MSLQAKARNLKARIEEWNEQAEACKHKDPVTSHEMLQKLANAQDELMEMSDTLSALPVCLQKIVNLIQILKIVGHKTQNIELAIIHLEDAESRLKREL